MVTSQQLKEFINNYSNILIIPSESKKLDSLPAAFALSLILKNLNKNSNIFFKKEVPSRLEFLRIQKILNPQNNHQALITLGEEKTNVALPTLNINDAQIPISEIITKLIKEMDAAYITKKVATSLLTGVIGATQNFQKSNIKPQTLFVAAYLISKEADNETIVKNLYKTKSLELIKLWGYAISKFSYEPKTKIGWTILEKEDLQKSKAKKSDLVLLMNELKGNFSQANFFVISVDLSNVERFAILHATKIKGLEPFAKKFNLPIKNSSIVIALNKNLPLKNITEQVVADLTEATKNV